MDREDRAPEPARTPPDTAPPDTAPAEPTPPADTSPETARRPVPGVKHEPEPDAGNIMPADDGPGTL
jgi:hypothetical protein